MVIPSPYPKLHSYFDRDGRPQLCVVSRSELESFLHRSREPRLGLDRVDDAIFRLSALRGRHVKSGPSDSHGSLPRPEDDSDPEVRGLDYIVTTGDACILDSLLFTFRAMIYSFIGDLARGLGNDGWPVSESSVGADMSQGMNINVLLAGSEGYEWHYDSTPVTAVYYPMGSGESTFKEASCVGTTCIKTGHSSDPAMVVGDLSQIAHAVGPVSHRANRVSVPMAFWPVPGADHGGIGGYLFAGDDR